MQLRRNEKRSASGWPVGRRDREAAGDGFLLAFPSASQAIRGAPAVKTAVDRKAEGGFELQVRIAVHAGEPLVVDTT